jgi:EncFtn-like
VTSQMGFEHYHEPPDELPKQTRTFARMIASLIEKAEAIGWYEQRMAVETNSEARAIMANAKKRCSSISAWTWNSWTPLIENASGLMPHSTSRQNASQVTEEQIIDSIKKKGLNTEPIDLRRPNAKAVDQVADR